MIIVILIGVPILSEVGEVRPCAMNMCLMSDLIVLLINIIIKSVVKVLSVCM